MIELFVDTDNKEFMFNLGRAFARGEQIRIVNPETVDKKIIEEKNLGYAKSFNMMIKYWQDNNLTPNIFNRSPKDNKIFLICPVRRATEAEKNVLSNIITKYEKLGFNVHYPSRDTNQNPVQCGVNTGGYNICLENATAIASSKMVVLHYNPQSVGSMFDLGVTYETIKQDSSKKFVLENQDVELKNEDYIAGKIKELLKHTVDNTRLI